MTDEFRVHRLNVAGMARANGMAASFDNLLEALQLPLGRERALVITKLQEACFWAKRAIATDPANQE